MSEIKCAGAAAVLQLCDTLIPHVSSSKDQSQYYSLGSHVFLTLILHKSHTAQHCGGSSDEALSTALVRRPSPHPLLFICCPCNPPQNAPHSEATLFCVCLCSRFISKDHFVFCHLLKSTLLMVTVIKAAGGTMVTPRPSLNCGYSSWVCFHNSSLCGGTRAFHHWLQTIEEIEKTLMLNIALVTVWPHSCIHICQISVSYVQSTNDKCSYVHVFVLFKALPCSHSH